MNGPRGSLATVPLVLLIKGEPRGQGVAYMFLLYSKRGQGMAHVSTLQIKPTRPCGLLYRTLSSSACPGNHLVIDLILWLVSGNICLGVGLSQGVPRPTHEQHAME